MAQKLTKANTVLIVDDEEEILQVVKAYMKKLGFNVHAFTDSVTALEHFRYSPKEYSVILTDVRMPVMSGLELARKVKELNPEVKVFIMSAFEINQKEFSKVLPSTKVEGFLEKPFSLENIEQLLKKQFEAFES